MLTGHLRSLFQRPLDQLDASANYTIFYSPDKGTTVQRIKYQDKFAFVAQVDADIDISKKVFLNIDLKKIFLNTTATADAPNLTPASDPELALVLQNINADVKIRLWLIGIDIDRHF